jgi:hypothetical protein
MSRSVQGDRDGRSNVNKPTHDYVGRKVCGCCVTLISDLGPECAHDIAGAIRAGLTIERVPREQLATIMAEPTFMACPHGQLPLEGI